MVDYYVATTAPEGPAVAKRPQELKQLWMTLEDMDHFQSVAKKLESLGYDVRHRGKYSLTKVMRSMMLRELAGQVETSIK